MEQETFCYCLPILISRSSIFTTKYLDPKITFPTSKFCNTNFIFICPLWSTPLEIKGFWDSLFHLIEKENKSTLVLYFEPGDSPFWSKSPSHPHFLHFGSHCRMHRVLHETKLWSALQDPHVTPLMLKAVRPQDQAKFSLKQNFTEPKQASTAQVAGLHQ